MPQWVGFLAWIALALGGLAAYFFEDDDASEGTTPESFASGVRSLLLPLMALGLGIALVALTIGSMVGVLVALIIVALLLATAATYVLHAAIERRRNQS